MAGAACRYVERNALNLRLAARAEAWEHALLWRWQQHSEPEPRMLSRWPMRRSLDWVSRVNQPLTERELEAVRRSVDRGRPFGAEE